MSKPESDASSQPEDIDPIHIPDPQAPAGSAEAFLEVLRNQLKAYEDAILTLTAKRNQINASIKHRRAQAQAVADSLRKLERQRGA